MNLTIISTLKARYLGILLTHLQNLPCNAHEIAEIEVPSGSVKDSVQSEIGAASYGTLSLINHSCDPNVVRHYHSSRLTNIFDFVKYFRSIIS